MTDVAPLPRGRMPAVGVRELVAALHRRRDRRRESAAELFRALSALASAVEWHLERVAEVKRAVEAQGGNLDSLRYYDTMMAKLRAELRFAERSMAEVFSSAASKSAGPA